MQGCCRDHTLFCVGALRQHGIPARSLVGFATYFDDDYNCDHVIVQMNDEVADRWVRFDPEIEAPLDRLPDPQDIESGKDAPFRTAAEVGQGYRSGELDGSLFGVGPGSPFGGPWYILNYVLMQLAHRSADSGDAAADDLLLTRYRTDERLHPGTRVTQHSRSGTRR